MRWHARRRASRQLRSFQSARAIAAASSFPSGRYLSAIDLIWSDRCTDDVTDLPRLEQPMISRDGQARVGELAKDGFVHQLASPNRLICPSTKPLGLGAGLGSAGLGLYGLI